MADTSTTLSASDQSLFDKEGLGRMMKIGMAVGVVSFLIAGFLGRGADDHYSHFMFSYLVAFAFFLSVGLGGLFFTTLQHITHAGWSVILRRMSEAIANALPVMAILFLPILIPLFMGSHALYEWADQDLMQTDHVLHEKAAYLSVGFFTIRWGIYFIIWTLLARFYLKKSTEQDQTGDVKLTSKMEAVSAPGMLLFALTCTFAAIDAVMSVQPHWFSTIVGVYFFSTSVVSVIAVMILMFMWLQKRGKLGIITVEHYHDLGKLLFAFTFFWGYIAFSQYMLQWYANIPEDTQYYVPRQQGDWVWFSFILLFGHLLVPFVVLLSRWTKRKLGRLKFWAIWMLVFHWVDMYYLVMPGLGLHPGHETGVVSIGLLDVFCFLAVGGVFMGTVAMVLRKHALAPLKDPRLAESLTFENV